MNHGVVVPSLDGTGGFGCLIIAWIPFPCVNIFAVEQYTAFYLKFYKLAGYYYKRLLNCRLLLYI